MLVLGYLKYLKDMKGSKLYPSLQCNICIVLLAGRRLRQERHTAKHSSVALESGDILVLILCTIPHRILLIILGT